MSKASYRWLHVAPPADIAGFASRASRTMTAFSKGVTHDVAAATEAFERPAGVRGATIDFPAIEGAATPGKLNRIAKALTGYDLVLTHGYGAMNVVMAHTAFGQAYTLPPLIHHESEMDSAGNGTRADWYRRVALGRSNGLVVPTERLEERALVDWQQPMGRVKGIADGIEIEDYRKAPKPDSLPRLIKRSGECWIGTIAPDARSGLGELFAVLSDLPEFWHLVVLGVEDRESLTERAAGFGIDDRVHAPQRGVAPKAIMGLFDLFAMPAADHVPVTVPMAAMAAGVPVTHRGTVEQIETLPEALRTLSDPAEDLRRLAQSNEERRRLGELARKHARTAYDATPMWGKLRRLYASAMGAPDLP